MKERMVRSLFIYHTYSNYADIAMFKKETLMLKCQPIMEKNYL